jgi:DNA-binding XRE family transcriptional regulator
MRWARLGRARQRAVQPFRWLDVQKAADRVGMDGSETYVARSVGKTNKKSVYTDKKSTFVIGHGLRWGGGLQNSPIGGPMITGGQLRAARAYAKVSAAELAEMAGVARTTVVKAESVDGPPPLTVTNLRLLQETLERIGVIFGGDGSVNYRPNTLKA